MTDLQPSGASRTPLDHDAVAQRSDISWRGIAVRLSLFAVAILWADRAFGDDKAGVVIEIAGTTCVIVGLHALIHWSGQVSLGHMMLVGFGGFFTANFVLEQGWPPPIAALFGGLMAMIFSIAIGIPALRIRGFSLAITTLAAASAADSWLFRQEWLVGGSLGILVPDDDFLGRSPVEPEEFMLPAVAMAASLVVMTAWIGRSGIGRALRLVAADEEVAASYGINVGLHRFGVFLYSGFCAGIGGSIMVLELGRASPAMFPAEESITFVAAVLLGGPGLVWGSVLAAALLVLVPEILDWGRYDALIAGAALVLAVRFAPGGLNEAREHIYDRFRKKSRSKSASGDTA